MDHRRLLSSSPPHILTSRVAGTGYRIEASEKSALDAVRLALPECSVQPDTAAFGGRITTERSSWRVELPARDDPGPDEIERAALTPDLPLIATTPGRLSTFEGTLVLERESPNVVILHPWPQRPVLAALLIYHRLLCLSDHLFFHASSVVSPRGVAAMFIGPKGAGKSTTALTLSHFEDWRLLADETTAYEPSAGTLLPFLRPVGIKPGPRAAATNERLRRVARNPEAEGPIRISASEVAGGVSDQQAPLDSIFFLEGIGSTLSIRACRNARTILERLQPSISSVVNRDARQLTFQLATMISRSKLYDVQAGSPEETANRIGEVIESC